MSIRRIFLALVVPLFLLLAAVNGGLLYVWERAEAERGLEAQAISAAVTVAAFLDAPGRAEALIANPTRMAGLRTAVASAEGLEGLWVVSPGQQPVRLAGTASADGVATTTVGARPSATPLRRDGAGRPHVLGLAPLRNGGAVVARINAEPLSARVTQLQRLVAALLLAAGAIGLFLALGVARTISRELAWNRAQVAAISEDAASGDDARVDYRIRETRDLGDAVRLMRSSVAGRMARGRRELARRDRARTVESSIAALRAAFSPALVTEAAGRRVAARLVGRAAPGTFVALAQSGDKAGMVLAEVDAQTPSDALALALAARSFLEVRLLDGDPSTRVSEAETAYGLARHVWRVWDRHEPLKGFLILTLATPEVDVRAKAYGDRASGLGPDEVADDLEALLGADGAIAVIASTQLCQGAVGVGTQRENAGEA